MKTDEYITMIYKVANDLVPQSVLHVCVCIIPVITQEIKNLRSVFSADNNVFDRKRTSQREDCCITTV